MTEYRFSKEEVVPKIPNPYIGENNMETTTPAVKSANLPSTDVFAMADNETVDFDSSDILIPKLLLMQGPSQLVAEGKAAQGDMIDSVTGEILGNKSTPVNFVPLVHFKLMTVMKDKGGMFVYDRTEPWSPQMAARQWEEEINGVKYRNYPTLNFYVMLEKDLNGTTPAMPVLLSFKSTSLKAGKKLISLFAKAADARRQPCSLMGTLSCSVQKGDKGPYHSFDVKYLGETPQEYGPKLGRWLSLLKTTKVRVHEENEDADSL